MTETTNILDLQRENAWLREQVRESRRELAYERERREQDIETAHTVVSEYPARDVGITALLVAGGLILGYVTGFLDAGGGL